MVHSRIETTNEPTISGRRANDFLLNLAGKLNFWLPAKIIVAPSDMIFFQSETCIGWISKPLAIC